MYKYKLSVFEKIGFGSGDMAINLVFSSMMLIITFFTLMSSVSVLKILLCFSLLCA